MDGERQHQRGKSPLAVSVRRVLLVYSPIVVVAIAWAVARAAGFSGLMILGWLPGSIAMGVAAYFFHRASRLPTLDRAGRRFWRLLAIAAALITPATNPLTEANLGGGGKPGPMLVVAMSAMVTALLLVLWALLRLPVPSRSRGDWLRLGLDAATVLIGAATFLWHYVLEPLVGSDVDLRTVLGLVILCLVCLLAVLAVVKLILAGTDAVDGVALRMLALVVLIGAFGSALVALLPGPRYSGTSDVITTVEGLVSALAGVVQYRRAGAGRTAQVSGRGYSMLPYLAVGAIDTLLIVVTVREGGSLPVVIGAVLASVLVAVRQMLVFRDNAVLVSSLREHQRLLRVQATHDPLTGLPNRALFTETLEAAFAQERTGRYAALLIDLDDFKCVNDTLGHAVGDGLLVEVGRRLSMAVRPDDLVARLGGDEFAVLLPGATEHEANEVAGRVLALLHAAPVVVDGHRLAVGASVGVAERDPADDPEALLHHADLAMYAAKQRGKGKLVGYTPALEPVRTGVRVG